MANVFAGSLTSVSIDNTLWDADGEADASIFIGGLKMELKSNGSGDVRKVGSRQPWTIDGVKVACDSPEKLVKLQKVSEKPGHVPIVIELLSGHRYGGIGTIVDEPKHSTKEGLIEIKLSGPGKLQALK